MDKCANIFCFLNTYISPVIVLLTPFIIWFATWRSNVNLEKVKGDLQGQRDNNNTTVGYVANTTGDFKRFVSEKEVNAINEFWIYFVDICSLYLRLATAMNHIKMEQVHNIIKDECSRLKLLKFIFGLAGIDHNKDEGFSNLIKDRLPDYQAVEKLQVWLPRNVWNRYRVLIKLNGYLLSELMLIELSSLPWEELRRVNDQHELSR